MQVWIYPMIFTTQSDEDGQLETVSSPDWPGLVTAGRTRTAALAQTIDALATRIDAAGEAPAPGDPSHWALAANQQLVNVPVDMQAWHPATLPPDQTAQTTVQVTVPAYLTAQAAAFHIDLSMIMTHALQRFFD
ncbi:type II toxin-antitoxin system HicB family antitoxin [Lacticaseibacillus nasuensis]|uniref:type II toxin-antitoxin system HicB family antitoxin n=1 Tax=Lacticaseibacillus nasuensis TaxID=944671 RepID=UPI0022473A17|nr:hypothetical protein [Lacticaseibacillus nasuensis]MCX2454527.1 hypothetical protein [Lacticaseibacillus nasuensis]